MNVHAGDMARVVSNGEFVETPGILDRIVEIVRPAVPWEEFTALTGEKTTIGPWSDDIVWVIRSKTPLPNICRSALREMILMFNERPMSDRYLRRLGGVPVEDEVHDEVLA